MLDGSRIPDTNLVPSTRASGDLPKPPTPLKVEPNTVGLLAAEWLILFQPHPDGPSRDKNLTTGKTTKQSHMGPPLHLAEV